MRDRAAYLTFVKVKKGETLVRMNKIFSSKFDYVQKWTDETRNQFVISEGLFCLETRITQ